MAQEIPAIKQERTALHVAVRPKTSDAEGGAFPRRSRPPNFTLTFTFDPGDPLRGVLLLFYFFNCTCFILNPTFA